MSYNVTEQCPPAETAGKEKVRCSAVPIIPAVYMERGTSAPCAIMNGATEPLALAPALARAHAVRLGVWGQRPVSARDV